MRITNAKPAFSVIIFSLAVMALLSGCTDPESGEFQRLVCEVSAVNEGTPLIFAYIDIGDPTNPDDNTTPVDYATFTFHARPYSNTTILSDDGPYSYFHITEYDVLYHPIQPQGADMELFNMYNCGVDVIVPVNESASVAVLVADRYMKDTTLFSELFSAVVGVPPLRETFTARVEVVFRGHETGNQYQIDNPVAIRGSFMAHCIGAVAD